MADVRSRARDILNALPLTERQRERYSRGIVAMDEATLERTTSKLEAALERSPQTLADARQLLAEQRGRTRKRAVLFVESEKLRRNLEDALERELTVEIASSGEEAIQLVRQAPPDVVIYDIRMPESSGIAAIQRIRALAGRCPIFVLTASPEQDGQVAAFGATGYRAAKAEAELSAAVRSAIEASVSFPAKY